MKLSRPPLALVLLSLAIVSMAGFAGCSSETDVTAAVAKMNDTNLKKVANLYASYQRSNDYLGPKDLDSFKKYIAQMTPRRLQLMHVDLNNLDAMFVSERDQKPIKIRFGVQGSMMGPPNAVAFEETGVDGKRMVAFTNASVVEANDATYNDLWEGKSPGPPPASTPSG